MVLHSSISVTCAQRCLLPAACNRLHRSIARLLGAGIGGKCLFAAEEKSGRTLLVWLRAYVRKGGKLKYELDGLRWKSSYTDEGDPEGQGPPSGIFFF
jgi:hypothetical protein